ncbi:MAG: Hpt domain-containing protein [Planctomycetota bacterium]|jgi:HPt (histidine-containing phosphotransfer) domain-containing protein
MSDAPQGDPLHSDLAGDPTFEDLLESFVGQLPARAAALRAAFDGGEMDRAMVLAHQLKGAAGSYGFQPITDACLHFERCADGGSPAAETEAALRGIESLCHRATPAPPS